MSNDESETIAARDLVARYLRGNPEEREAALAALHAHADERTIELANSLAQSGEPAERAAAGEIVGQIGGREPRFVPEAFEVVNMLLDDASPTVLEAAARAAGHRPDPRLLEKLLRLVAHPDDSVRSAVAFAFAACAGDARAVNALVGLASDASSVVRGWAVTSLCRHPLSDVVKATLLKACSDVDAEVRGDAMLCLAENRVSEVEEIVASELAGDFHGSWAIEAARELAHPRFCALLKALAKQDSVDRPHHRRLLEEAIRACCGVADRSHDG